MKQFFQIVSAFTQNSKVKIIHPSSVFLFFISVWILICFIPALEQTENGNLVAHSYSVWGDWSVHFTFISNFIERGSRWITGDNPLFWGAPFQYPFLSHALTAAIAILFQTDVVSTTYMTSLLLMFLLPFALRFFFKQVGLKPWTAFIATVLFLFMGGFQCFDASLNLQEPLTNQFKQGSVFTQFLIFEFFPQRAFLFGLIFFLIVGGVTLKKLKEYQFNFLSAFCLIILISSLSLVHLHTWIAASTLILFFFLFYRSSNSNYSKIKFFTFGLSVAMVSAVFIWFLLLRHSSSPYKMDWAIWYPGWAQNTKSGIEAAHEMNLFWFWIYNTGFFLPLAYASIFSMKSDHHVNRDAHQDGIRPLTYAGLFLFALGYFFNLQPYFYDNLKIFTYSFLFLAPAVALFFEKQGAPLRNLWGQKINLKTYLKTGFLALLLILQCLSANLDLNFFRTKHQQAEFFSASEIELAQEFKKIRNSVDSLVLIHPIHNHWVPCLTGNPVVMGYAGWLWSWGIQYQDRERKVNAVLLGQKEAESSFSELRPDYIVVRENDEINHQEVNQAYLRGRFQLILEKSGWLIFSTKSPSTSVR